MLLGAIGFALYIGYTTSILQSHNASKRLYAEKYSSIKQYMLFRKVKFTVKSKSLEVKFSFPWNYDVVSRTIMKIGIKERCLTSPKFYVSLTLYCAKSWLTTTVASSSTLSHFSQKLTLNLCPQWLRISNLKFIFLVTKSFAKVKES